MSEQIYYNGNILTMEDNIYTDAILVKDDLISKIGTFNEIIKYKTPNTKLIDLKNTTLMPSFIDPHSHITALANTLCLVNLNDSKNFFDIINKLKDFKDRKNLNSDDWIIGFGYDDNFLAEGTNPNKNVLDNVSLENPILISHASGHMGVVNSKALKILGISKITPNPMGGVIGRLSNSLEPNGYLEEKAFIEYSSKVPKPSLNSMCKFLNEAENIYLSYGITTVQDGYTKESEFNLLKKMSEEKKLNLDVVSYIDLKDNKFLVDNNKNFLNTYFNNLKIGGYKIFLDGSPQGKTAWLTKPYENSTDGYRGYPIYDDDTVKSFIKTSLDENIQLITHCNGDAAADQLINSFKSIIKEHNYKNNTRPVMIHAQTVRYDQIDKMKEINMMPSYFVAHTYYWGDTHIKNLGEERAFKISPAKTTLDKGVKFTFHQDSPVVPPNMIFTVHCAVNRVTKNGINIGKIERVPVLEALKAVTINAAYQYFEEDKKGSIKEGKLANFVILDKNPLKVDINKIKDIKILKTIKNGRILYSID